MSRAFHGINYQEISDPIWKDARQLHSEWLSSMNRDDGSTFMVGVITCAVKRCHHAEPLHDGDGIITRIIKYGSHSYVLDEETKAERDAAFNRLDAAPVPSHWLRVTYTSPYTGLVLTADLHSPKCMESFARQIERVRIEATR